MCVECSIKVISDNTARRGDRERDGMRIRRRRGRSHSRKGGKEKVIKKVDERRGIVIIV